MDPTQNSAMTPLLHSRESNDLSSVKKVDEKLLPKEQSSPRSRISNAVSGAFSSIGQGFKNASYRIISAPWRAITFIGEGLVGIASKISSLFVPGVPEVRKVNSKILDELNRKSQLERSNAEKTNYSEILQGIAIDKTPRNLENLSPGLSMSLPNQFLADIIRAMDLSCSDSKKSEEVLIDHKSMLPLSRNDKASKIYNACKILEEKYTEIGLKNLALICNQSAFAGTIGFIIQSMNTIGVQSRVPKHHIVDSGDYVIIKQTVVFDINEDPFSDDSIKSFMKLTREVKISKDDLKKDWVSEYEKSPGSKIDIGIQVDDRYS
jgi:hypothetical protein